MSVRSLPFELMGNHQYRMNGNQNEGGRKWKIYFTSLQLLRQLHF